MSDNFDSITLSPCPQMKGAQIGTAEGEAVSALYFVI